MPKNLDYPSASFKNCLEIADAVDALGGSCSPDTCAQKLKKQPTSGGYRMLLSSAGKYGLINSHKGTISITNDYKLLKHAYTDEERKEIEQKCFLKPEIFSALYQRFHGKVLPLNMLDKLMIRELDVDENAASRVSGYFVKGLKDLNLIDGAGVVIAIKSNLKDEQPNVPTDTKEDKITDPQQSPINPLVSPYPHVTTIIDSNVFTLQINGPGLNTVIQIIDEDDFAIVDVTLKKIKKALKAAGLRHEDDN